MSKRKKGNGKPETLTKYLELAIAITNLITALILLYEVLSG